MSDSEIVDDEEELYGSSEDDEGRSPEEDEELYGSSTTVRSKR